MRVTGFIHDTHYDVTVNAGEPPRGSVKIARLVESWAGRQVVGGPTGPLVTVDPADPDTVLALLAARTTVTGVEGDDTTTKPRRVGIVL